MSKRTTVLFGAGSGAAIWLQRWRDAESSYTIVDNDSSLWGKERYGVKIAPPAAIQSMTIDKVIILFSHVREARNQLLALGVPPWQIQVPPKPDFRPQPFRTASRRKNALSALQAVLGALIGVGVAPIVEQGAALGLYRDSDLIAWDNDIDIGVAWKEISRIPVQSIGAFLSRIDGTEISVTLNGTGLLVTWLQGADQIPFTVFSRREDNERAVSAEASFTTVDVSAWLPPKLHRVGSFNYPLPAMPERYFEQIYGADWKIPRSDFSFADYPSISRKLLS